MLDSPYRGRLISVGTRHGKQAQLAPPFRAVLGADLVTPPDLDTDQFGTFTGEVPRSIGALEAARAKARLAMNASGLPYGLASEASYGSFLGAGWCGHEEILLFCDDLLGIEVLEGHRTTSVPGASHRVNAADELPHHMIIGLPEQALIVRDNTGDIVKGITDTPTLRSVIAASAARSTDGIVIVEPDLRAHHNPSRRRVLTSLAHTMARRLATYCPDCGAPGFGRVNTEPGLRCRVCESPTRLVHNEIHGCAACPYLLYHPVEAPWADPAYCPECNP